MHELTNCVQVIAEMLHFGGACVGQMFAKSYACALASAIISAALSENRIAIRVALADFTIPLVRVYAFDFNALVAHGARTVPQPSTSDRREWGAGCSGKI
jgi:hypothetical protein